METRRTLRRQLCGRIHEPGLRQVRRIFAPEGLPHRTHRRLAEHLARSLPPGRAEHHRVPGGLLREHGTLAIPEEFENIGERHGIHQ